MYPVYLYLMSCVGNLPGWLRGTLLRNGPGMFTVGDTTYNHWFDGMALMHSFAFKDGKAFKVQSHTRGYPS